MKRFAFLIITFVLISQSIKAKTFEQLTIERYKEVEKSCAERKTDSQRIDCLEDMVRYLQAKIDWKCKTM